MQLRNNQHPGHKTLDQRLKTRDSRPRTRDLTLRAQVTGEFMVVFAAMLLLFYVFYSLYFAQATNSMQANEKLSAMRVACGVRAAINYVYLAGDGTIYNTSLRTSGMTVSINNGVVGVESRYAGYYLPLLTTNINATSIGPGDLVIRNEKGAILIG